MCWAPQDDSFFFQDLHEDLYQFTVDGSHVEQWDIGELIGGGSSSSEYGLDVSPNGRRIIFDVDLAWRVGHERLGRRAAGEFSISILKPIPPRA